MILLSPCLPSDCMASEAQRTETLLATARAITSSAIWRQLERASFVVRPGPTPLFGAVGYFDDAIRTRFSLLQRQLERVLPRVRRVTYADAELAAECLAQNLLERFGRADLGRFRFTAIPRGGYIVLGMLSYLLDIAQDQICEEYSAESEVDETLVVVDDIALTGNRFHRFLAERPGRKSIVFAPLFAPPELLRSMEEDERVLACLSAHDLRDLAHDAEGEGYESWRERWRARRDGASYWIGQPEPVCFPWSEPDFGFWNPVTDREEKGWNLAPPELCLKHRPYGRSEDVQVQPTPAGSLQTPEGVVFAEFENSIVIASAAWSSSFSLNGVAAQMWMALLNCPSEDEAAEEVAQAYSVAASRVRTDLEAFVDGLLEKGALTRCVA